MPTNLHSVIPTKVGIQFFEFQSFPINCLSIECLDSRLRGNDESIHTETCIPSFPRPCIPSFPRTCIPSFPRACIPSFPRKRESSFLSFSHFR
ncbi:hypothetical protein COH89_06565 [Neisseria meningitidis]|nr:hypothetical protein COH89_06565 [Neisseria meningitidis]